MVELHNTPSSRVTKNSSESPLRVKMKTQPWALEPVAKVHVRKTRLSDITKSTVAVCTSVVTVCVCVCVCVCVHVCVCVCVCKVNM